MDEMDHGVLLEFFSYSLCRNSPALRIFWVGKVKALLLSSSEWYAQWRGEVNGKT